MRIQHFFESQTATLSYVVDDGREAVLLDPVRDYAARTGRSSWAAARAIARYIDDLGLSLRYVIDTHVHADHLSGLPFFRERYGATSVTGRGVVAIQERFAELFGLGDDFVADGHHFDRLVDAGDRLAFGDLEIEAIATPGHTPAHLSWRVGDALFLGDTLFMPDYGTARCDFPGGSAEELYDSVQRIYALPDATRLFVCHDYQPGGRAMAFETTVAEQKAANVQLQGSTSREDFVAFRQARDAELDAPRLILPALQVNIAAGELPAAAGNGRRYLKIPIDAFGSPAPDEE